MSGPPQSTREYRKEQIEKGYGYIGGLNTTPKIAPPIAWFLPCATSGSNLSATGEAHDLQWMKAPPR
jgi:hypothetical protein